jgi:hydroxymethylpyrimidine/phosphomethylpyrimidine kinase
MKHVLTIAGSDSSGGAGIQADLKTFAAHGVFGLSVITAVTAQNTQGVLDVQDVAPDMITRQIFAIFEDIRVDAVKIGMLSCAETILAIAESLHCYKPPNIVLDPVMISKNGFPLLSKDAISLLQKRLFPLANVITPNIPEAEWITGDTIKTISEMKQAAKKIQSRGSHAVLLKGGHREDDATDVLYDGANWHCYEAKRIESAHTHGTGCTLSSAIAANLAKDDSIFNAVSNAKQYIHECIADGLAIGKGIGPLNHFSTIYKKAGIDIIDEE